MLYYLLVFISSLSGTFLPPPMWDKGWWEEGNFYLGKVSPCPTSLVGRKLPHKKLYKYKLAYHYFDCSIFTIFHYNF